MLQRNPTPSRFILAVLSALWIGIAAAAPIDDLREAQRLYAGGRVQPALEKVDVFLKAQPRDPQGRFLRGLLLTEQKRIAEAIQVFTGLTEDFPELPEPYNNLAVLYASQGNYDKAKSALELAIHTHPSYATAHENLGDIYAQLASRAYDRALQLDKNNATASTKLSMVKDLFSSQRVAGNTRPTTAVAPPKAEPPKPEPAKPEPVRPDPPKGAEPKAEPPKVAAKPAELKPAPSPAPAAPTAAPAADEKAKVTAAIEGWAHAWSAKDVKGYLGAYSPDFEVPGGENRASWEKQRAERIEKPKSIEVGIKVQSMQVNGNEATATIRQAYKSDTLKNTTTKTLKLVKSGDRWLIKQERVGG
ncbi:MAG TPA: tetratricopeptide repeat protein [Usitatibacter sp.]|nr:tetratricopeptide repeat protein [Usitatibacter sp.]